MITENVDLDLTNGYENKKCGFAMVMITENLKMWISAMVIITENVDFSNCYGLNFDHLTTTLHLDHG